MRDGYCGSTWILNTLQTIYPRLYSKTKKISHQDSPSYSPNQFESAKKYKADTESRLNSS